MLGYVLDRQPTMICSVWKALRAQGIEEPYIQLLTELYDQQRVSVHADVISKHLQLEREIKQGDPLSTLLFNSLLQYIMKPLTEKWGRGGELRRRHPPHQHLAQTHDHHVRRPHHSHNGTQPSTTAHENGTHLQHDLNKPRNTQRRRYSRDEH